MELASSRALLRVLRTVLYQVECDPGISHDSPAVREFKRATLNMLIEMAAKTSADNCQLEVSRP
jgi:hypothetical protein